MIVFAAVPRQLSVVRTVGSVSTAEVPTFWRCNSAFPKKKILSLRIGPPIEPPKRFFRPAGMGPGGLVVGIARRVGVAGAEIVNVAVELIGAGARLRGHDRRDGLALFSVVVLGGDLDFGHRIGGGVDHDNAQNWVLVVGPIQLVGHAAEGLAVNLNLLRCLGIFIGRVGPAQHLRARQQQLQIGKVLVFHRQTCHLLLVEDGRHIGAVSL